MDLLSSHCCFQIMLPSSFLKTFSFESHLGWLYHPLFFVVAVICISHRIIPHFLRFLAPDSLPLRPKYPSYICSNLNLHVDDLCNTLASSYLKSSPPMILPCILPRWLTPMAVPSLGHHQQGQTLCYLSIMHPIPKHHLPVPLAAPLQPSFISTTFLICWSSRPPFLNFLA